MRSQSYSLFVILLFAVSAANTYSFPLKNGDYAPFPDYNVEITHLDLRLHADIESRSLEGKAIYAFTPKNTRVQELVWFAPETEIHSVTADRNVSLDYSQAGDTLIISFDEPLDPRENFKLSLSYTSKPSFGVHITRKGSMISSRLPGAVSHWLPGPVHPAIQATFTAKITVDEEYDAVFSGKKNTVTQKNGKKSVSWSSEYSTPLSELSFAVGKFDMNETFMGIKQIRVYQEEGVSDEAQRTEILTSAIRYIRDSERYLRNEFPATEFNIIHLEDHFWETKNAAYGVGFLYKSIDNLELQLWKAIISQWYGVSFRPLTWSDAYYMPVLQAFLAIQQNISSDNVNASDPLDDAYDRPVSLYDHFGQRALLNAKSALKGSKDLLVMESLDASIRALASRNTPFSDADFDITLYESVGRRVSVPDWRTSDVSEVGTYRIEFIEETPTEIHILAEPLGYPQEDSITINLSWESEGSLSQKEIKIDPNGDQYTLEPDHAITAIWITNISGQIDFTEVKPFPFWLHQMRRNEDAEKRKQAALALVEFASNPDLELALQDMLAREENPDVRAALYAVLSEITSGARGTERRFIDGTRNQEKSIRHISMKALRAYRGVPHVEQHVLSTIQVSSDIALVNEAIRTYRYLLEPEDFRRFAIRFLREDRQDLLFSATLLVELFELPVASETTEAAKYYLSESWPFELRWLAYKLLLNNSEELQWRSSFVDNYYTDPDPRIRFLAVASVSVLDQSDKESFIEQRLLKEYDQRILEHLQRMARTL
ncbi:hypothetical protein QLX67_00340 [Balneolaceae bacterium ANBcel3]|nr:hypothetical protein [Balneolaceae bacterium ANBcel3]